MFTSYMEQDKKIEYRALGLFTVQYDTVRHSKDDIYWRHII